MVAAASFGVGIGLTEGSGGGGGTGVAVSGAGAVSQNVILSKTRTFVQNSVVNSADDILLSSKSNQSINSVVVAASAAIGGGSKTGVGVGIGASIARNMIGYDWDWSEVPAEVRSYVKDASLQQTPISP